MGSALARALISGGYDVVVWNRSPARAEPLMARGARLAASVADAVAVSNLIIICVLDAEASRAVVESDGVARNLAAKTIVDLTSATPQEMLAQQARICWHGGRFVAGGIMAFPANIGHDGVLLYAGDAAAFEEHRSTLACFGGSLEFLGPDPSAASHAFCTLSIFVEATVGLFLEASAVAKRYGIPMETYFRLTLLARDMLHGQLRDCTDRVVAKQFSGDEAHIDLHLHFVRELCATFAKTGIPVKMTEAFMALLKLASARGYGNCDLAAIAEALALEPSLS